jgi:tRNA dimethylallyltransferase
MKLSTRQYAKRQVVWIKSKLIPAVEKLGNHEVTIVLLDATGESVRGS